MPSQIRKPVRKIRTFKATLNRLSESRYGEGTPENRHIDAALEFFSLLTCDR